jgi:hypothetical protein
MGLAGVKSKLMRLGSVYIFLGMMGKKVSLLAVLLQIMEGSSP